MKYGLLDSTERVAEQLHVMSKPLRTHSEPPSVSHVPHLVLLCKRSDGFRELLRKTQRGQQQSTWKQLLHQEAVDLVT